MKGLFVNSCIPLLIALLVSCGSGSGGQFIATKPDSLLFRKLILSWNDAHNKRDSMALDSQYDDSIFFYGSGECRQRCLALKCSFFRKFPAFSQEIVSDIKIEMLSEAECKCSFDKKVRLKTTGVIYPAYLIFKKEKGIWKIKTESDLATDRYLEKRKDGSLEGKDISGFDSIRPTGKTDTPI